MTSSSGVVGFGFWFGCTWRSGTLVAEHDDARRGRFHAEQAQPPGLVELSEEAFAGAEQQRVEEEAVPVESPSAVSCWARTPLPRTAMLPSPSAFSVRSAGARSPARTRAFVHESCASASVRVAMYFGVAFRWAAIGLPSGWRGQKAAIFS